MHLYFKKWKWSSGRAFQIVIGNKKWAKKDDYCRSGFLRGANIVMILLDIPLGSANDRFGIFGLWPFCHE